MKLEDVFELFAGLAPFVIAAVVAFAISLRFERLSNKSRFLLLFVVYLHTAASYGALGLGDGDFTRPDSVTVVELIYQTYRNTHGLFAAFLALSVVPNYFAAFLAFALQTAQQFFLLRGAKQTGDANWYYFVWAGVMWLGTLALFFAYLRPARRRAAIATPADFDDENPMHTSIGVVGEYVVKVAAAVGFAVYLALYVVDQAWLGLLPRLANVLLRLAADLLIKLVVGLVVLVWFKSQEDTLANWDLGLALTQGNDTFVRRPLATEMGATPRKTMGVGR